MGLNTNMILTTASLKSQAEIEAYLGIDITYTMTEEASLEDGLTSFKSANDLYAYTNEKGTILLPDFYYLLDDNTIPKQGTVLQVMISDVSSTYYGVVYKNGELVQKLILTEGEIAEEEGSGYFSEEVEYYEKFWQVAEALIGLTEEEAFEQSFRQYFLGTDIENPIQ